MCVGDVVLSNVEKICPRQLCTTHILRIPHEEWKWSGEE
jgi:hypothetical protein